MKQTITILLSLMLAVAASNADEKGTVKVSGGSAFVVSDNPNATAISTGNGDVVVVTASAAMKAVPGEKTAYLGVTTAPVAEALCAQLKLPTGIGLVVEFIDEKSPAAKVLKKNDILHKLGDQILVNHEQLQALLHTHKPGDQINLTIIRGGDTKQCQVKLGEHVGEVGELNIGGLNALPGEIAKAIQIVVGNTGSNMVHVLGPQISVMVQSNITAIAGAGASALQGIPQINISISTNFTGSSRSFSHATSTSSSQSCVKSNERGTFTLNCTNGNKHFTAVAPDGKILFTGPINTDAERDKLSDDLKKELEELEKTTPVESKPKARTKSKTK